jgi:hypothetical protein
MAKAMDGTELDPAQLTLSMMRASRPIPTYAIRLLRGSVAMVARQINNANALLMEAACKERAALAPRAVRRSIEMLQALEKMRWARIYVAHTRAGSEEQQQMCLR